MKFYFQGICKILVSIFNYFFQEDTYQPKRTAYELLISASICDEMDFVERQSRIFDRNGKEEVTDEHVYRQEEQITRNAPLIPDIKKQFKVWSANMREYDSIRKRLLDPV
jgi:hypothetical protein